MPLITATGAAGLGVAVLVSAGAAWAVSARTGREGHSSPLGGTLDENAVAYWFNTTGSMAWQIIRADFWASSVMSLTLVASLGAVGPHAGPRLRSFSDG